jgi:hypothetical protein
MRVMALMAEKFSAILATKLGKLGLVSSERATLKMCD